VYGYNVHQNNQKIEQYFVDSVESVMLLVKENYDSSKILL